MQASIEMQPMRHSNPRADTPTTAQGGGTHSPFVRTSQQVVQGVVAVSNQAVTHTQNAVIGQAFYQFPNATPENASERFNVKLKSYFDTEGEWRNSMTSKKQEFTKLFHRIIDKLKETHPEHWHNIIASPNFINEHISVKSRD